MGKFAKKDMSPFTRRVYEQGYEEGARESAISNAKALILDGDSLEKISRCIGLSIEEVEAIARQMKETLNRLPL